MSAFLGEPLLEVRNLTVRFPTPDGLVNAVDDLSYTLHRGETFGVGASPAPGRASRASRSWGS